MIPQMARRSFYFITHPNVAVDRNIPVPQWKLSDRGRERMHRGLAQPWVAGIASIYCSEERKAVDGAEILGGHLGLGFMRIAALGENDRSSTGFLPPEEFERMADRFFAEPEISVHGWERAVDAQSRIVAAVTGILAADRSFGDVAIVAHGAVGTLLFCHLAGESIGRTRDQPPNGGGNYFRGSFVSGDPESLGVHSWWLPFDEPGAGE